MCDATTAAWALGSVVASEVTKPNVPTAPPPPAPPAQEKLAPMASPEKKSSDALRSNPLKIDLANPLTTGAPASGLQIKL